MFALIILPIIFLVPILLKLVPPFLGAIAFIFHMYNISKLGYDTHKEHEDAVKKNTASTKEAFKIHSILARTVKVISLSSIVSSMLAVATIHFATTHNLEGTLIIALIGGTVMFGAMLQSIVKLEKLYALSKSQIETHEMDSSSSATKKTDARLSKLENMIEKDAAQFMDNMATLANAQEELLAMYQEDRKKRTKKL